MTYAILENKTMENYFEMWVYYYHDGLELLV